MNPLKVAGGFALGAAVVSAVWALGVMLPLGRSLDAANARAKRLETTVEAYRHGVLLPPGSLVPTSPSPQVLALPPGSDPSRWPPSPLAIGGPVTVEGWRLERAGNRVVIVAGTPRLALSQNAARGMAFMLAGLAEPMPKKEVPK